MLVAEEPLVRELLATQLRAAGCFPMAVASAHEGQRLAAQLVPDLIVIDLDAASTQDVRWALAVVGSTAVKVVRIAMLSSDLPRACGRQGECCDADLCVAKPFEPHELLRQLLRLLQPARPGERRTRTRPPLRVGGVELDRDQPTLRLPSGDGWRALDMAWTEHRLLAFLLIDADRAHSREAIRDAVWSDAAVDLRTVDQYVRRLRSTLDAAGARELVKTVQGVGYRLDLGALERSRP